MILADHKLASNSSRWIAPPLSLVGVGCGSSKQGAPGTLLTKKLDLIFVLAALIRLYLWFPVGRLRWEAPNVFFV